VHKDLIIKAQELYFQKLSLTDIINALELHVANEMFYKLEPPDKKRRKYYPSQKDIRNFIGRIRQIERFSKEDKKRMNNIITSIQNEENNNVLFTSTEDKLAEQMIQCDSSEEEFFEQLPLDSSNMAGVSKMKKPLAAKHDTLSFLFCYQTSEQQRLLKRYGTITFLVEIQHNSSVKRALTFKMFAIFVQTNVDYQAVGFLMFSKRRKEGLKEGLSTFKEWNSWWTPKYFLIDYTEEVLDAYSQLFSGIFPGGQYT